MPKLHTEAFSGAAPPPPPDSPLEIKVQPDDAIFGPGAGKHSERASGRSGSPLFGRLLLTAVLCGLAWAAGAYSSSGHLPFDFMKWSRASQQQQSERDEMLGTMRQMADDIRALKASVADKAAAPAQTTTGASGVTDLAARLDKLAAELPSKLSQMNDRLANLEQQIAASHSASVARAPAHAKHVEHVEHHDAFDPSQNPNAVGAPRPLGSH